MYGKDLDAMHLAKEVRLTLSSLAYNYDATHSYLD